MRLERVDLVDELLELLRRKEDAALLIEDVVELRVGLEDRDGLVLLVLVVVGVDRGGADNERSGERPESELSHST